MQRLIASDLVRLCWDETKGQVRGSCAVSLPGGLGGALVLDALDRGLISIVDDHVGVIADASTDEPLLAAVIEAITRRPRRE